MNLLDRMLRPSSIAVYGGKFAEAVIKQCNGVGFPGDIWPVHPNRTEIEGRPCFKQTRDLPGVPDAAFVGVNRNATIEIIGELSAMGAGGAVCYASGFKESGADGDTLQNQLVHAAGKMPVLGPNCYGFINYLDGALLWPDVHGGRRIDKGVALITQSSNVGVNLTMSRRGVPLAYLMTVGNQASVSLHDMIDSLCEDDRVSAIGMYIEGVNDAGAFADSVRRAKQKGVPIAVLKVGRTDASKAIAMSHTASLSGSDEVMSAYFERLGVARVDSVPVLLETMKVLHYTGPIGGYDVVSLSCSGGEASLMSDTARSKKLRFRPFTASEKIKIQDTVNPLVSVSNPFDYHTFDWGNAQRLQQTFTEVMKCGFDMSMLVLDFPREEVGPVPEWGLAWRAIQLAARSTGGNAAIVSSLPEALPEEVCEELGRMGLVPLLGIEEALSAVEAAAFIGKTAPGELLVSGPMAPGDIRNLDEVQAKDLLATYDIPVPDRVYCENAEEAIDFWRKKRRPTVMKIAGSEITHKTELGGVVLNLQTKEEITAAFSQLSSISDKVMTEEMAVDGVIEIIVGAARDPVVGIYMILGVGGVYAEALQDTQILMLPFDREKVLYAIGDLQCSEILYGWRKRPAADVDAIVETVMKIQRFLIDHVESIEEMDVNPIVVRQKDEGAVVVDVMIRMKVV